VEAVAGQLVRRDVVAKVAGLRTLGQQVSDHVAELMVRPGDLLVSVQKRRDVGVVVPARLMEDERVCLEHGLQSLARVAGIVSDVG